MTRIVQTDCDEIPVKLNSRPRKEFEFRTPAQCCVQIEWARARVLHS